MKIIAFAGSNSTTSINKQLVTYAANLLDIEGVKILDLNDYYIPTFSIDIEKNEGFPEDVKEFYDLVQQADVILLSFSEHNADFTAVFKSYMDWCSRIDYKFLTDKKTFAMSTSPGGYGGKNALSAGSKLITKFGANILEEFSLPKFNDNFADGKIINEEFNQELIGKIGSFKQKLFI